MFHISSGNPPEVISIPANRPGDYVRTVLFYSTVNKLTLVIKHGTAKNNF